MIRIEVSLRKKRRSWQSISFCHPSVRSRESRRIALFIFFFLYTQWNSPIWFDMPAESTIHPVASTNMSIKMTCCESCEKAVFCVILTCMLDPH